MKAITARSPHDSFSLSRRYFNWKKKSADDDEDDDMAEILHLERSRSASGNKPKKASVMAVAKLRWSRALGRGGPRLGTKVVGTLFGQRRGHVCFAFQEDFKVGPGFLVELATPTSALVKEMASGLVRIALECERRPEKKPSKLLEEPLWRTYCNGKKCGYAMRRDCGPEEWEVLNAIGPISMGAGVLPCHPDPDGEIMYMRAKFERVVGSKDSEAFYMMNPDANGGPELSIYLLRV